jgi:hypothetical protein
MFKLSCHVTLSAWEVIILAFVVWPYTFNQGKGNLVSCTTESIQSKCVFCSQPLQPLRKAGGAALIDIQVINPRGADVVEG